MDEKFEGPYEGPFVYSCTVCKKSFETGGLCPCCEDSKGKPVPLMKSPVTKQYFKDMLFRGEIFTK